MTPSLAGQEVGPGPLLTRAGVGAVEVHGEVVLGGHAEHVVVEGHHLLVLAVHVVDLDALDPPPLVEREGLVHRVPQVLPVEPEQDPDVAFRTVGHETGDVHPRDRRRDIGVVVAMAPVPLGVDEDVLEFELRREVDEMAEGRVVHPDLEIDVWDVGAAPPIPGHLARLDP
jgi:hypothetical protein